MKSAMIKKYGGPFFYKQCIGNFRTLMYPSPPPLRGTSTSKRGGAVYSGFKQIY